MAAFRDISFLGVGLWDGPVVGNEHYRERVAGLVHKDPFKGRRGDDGLVRIAGLELDPRRHRRTLSAIERTYTDPYRGTLTRCLLDREIRPSEIEVIAARAALKDAGLGAADVDAVLVHSFLSDSLRPQNATLVAHLLGIRRGIAINVDTLCNSAMTQAMVGAALIQSGQARHVLCVQSTVNSWTTDPAASSSVQESDMASALVLGPRRGAQLSFATNTEGRLWGAVQLDWTTSAAARPRRYFDAAPERIGVVFDEAIKAEGMADMVGKMRPLCEEALGQAEMRLADIDLLLSHQPLGWACSLFLDLLELPDDKSIDAFPRYANCGAASIPAQLREARRTGRLFGPGQRGLFFAPGAGYTYVAAAWDCGR